MKLLTTTPLLPLTLALAKHAPKHPAKSTEPGQPLKDNCAGSFWSPSKIECGLAKNRIVSDNVYLPGADFSVGHCYVRYWSEDGCNHPIMGREIQHAIDRLLKRCWLFEHHGTIHTPNCPTCLLTLNYRICEVPNVPGDSRTLLHPQCFPTYGAGSVPINVPGYDVPFSTKVRCSPTTTLSSSARTLPESWTLTATAITTFKGDIQVFTRTLESGVLSFSTTVKVTPLAKHTGLHTRDVQVETGVGAAMDTRFATRTVEVSEGTLVPRAVQTAIMARPSSGFVTIHRRDDDPTVSGGSEAAAPEEEEEEDDVLEKRETFYDPYLDQYVFKATTYNLTSTMSPPTLRTVTRREAVSTTYAHNVSSASRPIFWA